MHDGLPQADPYGSSTPALTPPVNATPCGPHGVRLTVPSAVCRTYCSTPPTNGSPDTSVAVLAVQDPTLSLPFGVGADLRLQMYDRATLAWSPSCVEQKRSVWVKCTG